MAALAVALVKLKDAEKMQEYGGLAAPTFAEYGGKLVARGKVQGILTGQSDLNIVAVMEFASLDKIDQWYNSPAYQKAIAVREEACDMTILKIELPSAA